MTSIAETAPTHGPTHGAAPPETEAPPDTAAPSDVQVWQALRDGLHRCLQLDREIAEHGGTGRGDSACAAFDREVDTVLEAYSDLTNRGLIGFFEDVLIERGMTGDSADDRGFDAGDAS
ncbi:hypothetical protein ACVDG3_06790 [Meridianimarinicoccus sp. RP-17]|uniref:hypothetical protein n=1 Tax=Meridianimarinicoccus zhengii TaxID=2056810 RepID=UPI000DACBA14|nr:hypothetical protein [Phycocomes zhengii]